MDVVPEGGVPQHTAVHCRPPQLQAFDTLHVWPAPQAAMPQSTSALQLSLTVPHLPVQVVVFGLLAQAHTFDTVQFFK
jgi:hypothetical protein